MGIKVENLWKSFGKEQVLRGLSLSVPYGQIVGVVGNNGCGKTVLMKCICGFLRADKGTITVNGRAVGAQVDFPDGIGIIIESPGFLPHLSGYKNLKLLAALKGRIGKEGILKAIDTVGLRDNMNKAVAKYSLGMRQRLGIAQAIMEEPKVLILDEPFNGLDKGTAAEIRGLLKKLKGQGVAILLASHNAADITELCDSVYEMEVYKG